MIRYYDPLFDRGEGGKDLDPRIKSRLGGPVEGMLTRSWAKEKRKKRGGGGNEGLPTLEQVVYTQVQYARVFHVLYLVGSSHS